jgi:hypothetical protein
VDSISTACLSIRFFLQPTVYTLFIMEGRLGMRRLLSVALTAAMAALAGCSVFDSQTRQTPELLWVDPSAKVALERGTREEPYLTLDKALEKAGDGTRIYLASGIYETNLTIKGAMSLRSEDEEKPVLRAADTTRPVIELAAESGAMLEGIRIEGGLNGVLVGRRALVEMRKCEVAYNVESGIRFMPSKGKPVLSRLEDTTITHNGAGLEIEDSVVSVILCTIESNARQGIVCRGNSGINVAKSTIEKNGEEGALLELGRKVGMTFHQSTIRGNGGDGVRIVRAPLRWLDRGQVLLRGNTLEGNGGFGLACVGRADGELLEPGTKYSRIKLEKNQFPDNAKGMAGGIEAW